MNNEVEEMKTALAKTGLLVRIFNDGMIAAVDLDLNTDYDLLIGVMVGLRKQFYPVVGRVRENSATEFDREWTGEARERAEDAANDALQGLQTTLWADVKQVSRILRRVFGATVAVTDEEE